jgi:hypothetical protein
MKKYLPLILFLIAGYIFLKWKNSQSNNSTYINSVIPSTGAQSDTSINSSNLTASQRQAVNASNANASFFAHLLGTQSGNNMTLAKPQSRVINQPVSSIVQAANNQFTQFLKRAGVNLAL